MNFREQLCYAFLYLLFVSCSGNDDFTPISETSKTPDFIVIGEDSNNVYQYNYTAEHANGDLINLTQENNIRLGYIELRQVNDLISFYRFNSGSFSIIQRNLKTGNTTGIDHFYTVSGERTILWGSNSETKIFMGYFSPQGSTNYGVRIIDVNEDMEVDINIDFGVNIIFQPLYSNGKLFLTYRDNQDLSKVAIINTETNTLLSTIDFGASSPSIFIDALGDIAVVLAENSADQAYLLYDFETLNLIEERAFSLDRLFAPGPLEAKFFEEKLFYINTYTQPAPIVAGPAIYDFLSSENSIIDMIAIADEVEQELESPIVLSSIDYKEDGNVFLVGYGKPDGSRLQGGVLVISSNGELINHIVLPFAPTYIVQ